VESIRIRAALRNEFIKQAVAAATRQDLIRKSLSVTKGKERFYRRLFSNIQYPNRALSTLDINKFMKSDILDAKISVRGETDNYTVSVSFFGTWDNYQGELSVRNIKDAVTKAYRSEDVYIFCSCPDFAYRYAYIATKEGYITERAETRPANKTNPHDSLGSCCKHCLLILMQSQRWIGELAKNIYKYIKYVERANPYIYKKIILPRIDVNNEFSEPEVIEEPIMETTEDTSGIDT
jgi:hypothetical protein